jgi:hypothetical protein
VRRGRFKIKQKPMSCVVVDSHDRLSQDKEQEDWRKELINYIDNPSGSQGRRVRQKALSYTLINGELYRRTVDGVLLKCLSKEESKISMGEVHEGMCGAHKLAYKMRWTLKRADMYWPDMHRDFFQYYKGCEQCQKFGKVQMAPANMLHPIIKPWPFRGWGLDFIGEIHPSSTKGHRFVLVATDYFTKWVEAMPLKKMTHQEVISFVP